MKRNILCATTLAFCALVFFSCSKNADTEVPLTIENLSGTYALKALVWTSGGTTINVYDQLPACEKDNLIQLKADKTGNYIDAGSVCNPPEDESGTWYVSHDTLYMSNSTTGGKIKSFDGTTLVLTGVPEANVVGTTTLVKK